MDALVFYALLAIVPMVLGLLAQGLLRRTVREQGERPTSSGLSGAEIAQRMLAANGIRDVRVVPTAGALTDHYDPRRRLIALSEPVFARRSVTAAAVAAHETGHAIQHARAYAPLQLRSAIFPLVSLASQSWVVLLLAGFVLQLSGLVWAAIALYAVAVAFHLVTLPVEFDASRRAGEQMRSLGLVTDGEASGTRKVLTAAASTYVVGALVAISQLLVLLAHTRDQPR